MSLSLSAQSNTPKSSPELQTLRLTELAHNFGNWSVLAVDGVVQAANFIRGQLACEPVHRCLNLRMPRERVLAHQWHGLVRRKVVFIILEHSEAEATNWTVGRVARHDVDLTARKRAIEQA